MMSKQADFLIFDEVLSYVGTGFEDTLNRFLGHW